MLWKRRALQSQKQDSATADWLKNQELLLPSLAPSQVFKKQGWAQAGREEVWHVKWLHPGRSTYHLSPFWAGMTHISGFLPKKTVSRTQANNPNPCSNHCSALPWSPSLSKVNQCYQLYLNRALSTSSGFTPVFLAHFYPTQSPSYRRRKEPLWMCLWYFSVTEAVNENSSEAQASCCHLKALWCPAWNSEWNYSSSLQLLRYRIKRTIFGWARTEGELFRNVSGKKGSLHLLTMPQSNSIE